MAPQIQNAWNASAANKFGYLAQGVGGHVNGTNTIKLIHKSEGPSNCRKDITYIQLVCSVCTENEEPNPSHTTMGGNLIKYPEDMGTNTAMLLLIKIFLNIIISTPAA